MGVLVIGISDLKVALPPDTLITYALGSCVGICLLDPVTKVGGLAHIMLPASGAIPGQSIYKFADTAIPELVRQMESRGALRSRIGAKIAGGAQMFEVQGSSASNAMWQIGQRNVAETQNTLRSLGIPILAQDVLQNYGRTVQFDPGTGAMSVKAINKGVKVL